MMDDVIRTEGSETKAMPKERLEALKARDARTLDNQHKLEDGDLNKIMDHNLYKATKSGDADKFIDALETVFESRKLALSIIFDQVTPSGNSMLHVAASAGKEDVLVLILSHFPYLVTRKNSLDDTPLHVAVQDKKLKMTRNLIALKRDLEIIYWKNKYGKSPLYLAVEKCGVCEQRHRTGTGWDILQLLLGESARDEAYAVKMGMSPVLASIKKKHTGLLKEIIDRLPNLLHARDENGGTPLHAAASDGRCFVVKLLLEKCPYLALQTDKNGSYPIHIACEVSYCYVTISELMRTTWPDDLAEIKNKMGQNILHVAAKAGNNQAAQYILKECGETNTEKMVNSKDVDGNTPLHLASMYNHCQVMRFLTKDKGFDLKLRNNAGLTALDVAMESQNLLTENPALIGRAILIVAGVPQSGGRDVMLPREQLFGVSKSSPAEWIKDQVNTLLLVATLVASVTFTAGVTLPGGYNASSDPHPGTATMLHHGMFRVFVIANMLAMYSSILAVVVLLWGFNRDFYVAELAYHLAGPLLLMALAGMSVAFFAAVTVAVSKLTWLGGLVMSVGVLYLVMVVVVLAALIFPSSKSTMHIVVFYYVVMSVVEKFVSVLVPVYCFFRYPLVLVYCFFRYPRLGVVRVLRRILITQVSLETSSDAELMI